jgi:hypothetical protein
MPNVNNISPDPYLTPPAYEVHGYDYDPSLQAHLVEIWSEKSGDDETIRTVTYRYGINYQPGVGYQSITTIKRMPFRTTTTRGRTCRYRCPATARLLRGN